MDTSLVLFIVLILGIITAVGLLVFTTLKNTRLTARMAELYRSEAALEAALDAAKTEVASLRKDAETRLADKINAEKNLVAAEEKIATLTEKLNARKAEEDELRKKLNADFEALSNKIFEESRNKMSSTNLEQISLILKPMKSTIADFRDRIDALNEANIKGQAGLEKHIETLAKMNSELSSDAKNLALALRNENKKAGNWGEAIFKKILEDCGFQEGIHFRAQENYTDTTGEQKRLMPDFVIDLPDSRSIVVDSKISLVGYVDYCSSQTSEAKRDSLDRFKKSVRAHLKEFATKYDNLPDARCGFKLMFMPIEPAYLLAIETDTALLEDAYAANVLIVSPSTVMSVLKYAEILVKNDTVAKNTREIANIGAKLYDRVELFMERFKKLGDRIRQASEEYEDAGKTLSEGSRSILNTARKLGAKSGIGNLEQKDESDD